MHGGLERPLLEAVKVKFCYLEDSNCSILQSHGIPAGERVEPTRKTEVVIVNKGEPWWRSEEHFDI